jgi:zinc protease
MIAIFSRYPRSLVNTVRPLILIGFALLITLPLPAHAARIHKQKLLKIERVNSPGGITAWLVEDHSLPIVSMQFEFENAGAAQDAANRQGLSQIAAAMLDEGAGDDDSQAFQQALDDNSISLGFGVGRDDLSGELKTLTRHEDLAFSLLNLALTKPRFDAEPLARMKAAALTRIHLSETDPDWAASRIAYDLAFQGHPYANNAGGTVSGIASITPPDLQDFVKNRLARSNLVVGVAGDITPAELGKRLDEAFGGLAYDSALSPLPDGAVKNGGTVALYKKDIPQTVMTILQPGISYKDKDYPAAEIMNTILGSGFGSRLMSEIREKRGLTYGISSALFDLRHLDAMMIEAQFKNENAAQVLSLTKQEMQKMRDAPVSATELSSAKSYLIGSMPLQLTSTSDIAGILVGLQSEDKPIDYLDRRAGLLNAVTVNDVQRVAKRVLRPDRLTVILVGQPEDIQPTRLIEKLPSVQ